jgi:hypothetical protein
LTLRGAFSGPRPAIELVELHITISTRCHDHETFVCVLDDFNVGLYRWLEVLFDRLLQGPLRGIKVPLLDAYRSAIWLNAKYHRTVRVFGI